jgi:hypothetical protein
MDIAKNWYPQGYFPRTPGLGAGVVYFWFAVILMEANKHIWFIRSKTIMINNINFLTTWFNLKVQFFGRYEKLNPLEKLPWAIKKSPIDKRSPNLVTLVALKKAGAYK